MSNEYTAEDFAQATMATRGEHDMARRIDDYTPWRAYTHDGVLRWRSDEYMARAGWVPVPQIERQRLALEDLREENYRLERILQTPLALKDLEVAWEAAEEQTAENPSSPGDLMIQRLDSEAYSVYRTGSGTPIGKAFRVLSRAPKREPWQDLADDLSRFEWDLSPNEAARELHAAGWRKGGEES